MIFGCKKFFAIEVTKLPIKSYYSTIPLRIWINSIPLGTFNDETYIPVFIARLERCLSNQIRLPEDIINSNTNRKFYYLINDETTSEYIVGLGDSFDDYQMYYFNNKNRVSFLWKLRENTFSNYSYEYDSNDLFEFELEKKIIENSILIFKEAIDNNIKYNIVKINK
ncbi:hypothetical protein [Neisseria polysaccharea]|uniref:hypothetical protein n=1 Tax=Neisseria polysaccharea TaxID=489 RepID=UPI0001D9DBFF|nr:hypothetical protein [Neisseria polysaccharea]EFH22954.1 hypothetical protein NEIPOLOT_01250 [Neisseria polysaccharea ATCC 43768]